MTEATTIQKNVRTDGTGIFDETGIRIEVKRGTIGIFGPHAPTIRVEGRSKFDSPADANRFANAWAVAQEIFDREVAEHAKRVERHEAAEKERKARELVEREERRERIRKEREEQERIYQARREQAERDRQERAEVDRKRAEAMPDRIETLMHEFADEPVRARARGYKQAVRAIVRVRETTIWERERSGREEFVPYVEYVYDNDANRPIAIEQIWRLEVRQGSRYRVLWDDGRSDLGHDKGADAIERDPKIPEYDASEEPV